MRGKEGKVEISNVSVKRERRKEGERGVWLVLMHVRAASAAEQGQEVVQSV